MKKQITGILILSMVIMSLLQGGCTPGVAKPQSLGRDELAAKIAGQMYPGSTYSVKEGTIYFATQIDANYQTMYLEQIVYGKFIENHNEYLAVLRAPEEVLVHAGGFYYAVAAVFDAQTNTMKSQLQTFKADEGELSIAEGKDRDYIIFMGSDIFQGWMMPVGGVYDARKGYWEKIWPAKDSFWNDRYGVFGNNRLVLYKRVEEPHSYETTLPPAHFEPEQELIWDRGISGFREP